MKKKILAIILIILVMIFCAFLIINKFILKRENENNKPEEIENNLNKNFTICLQYSESETHDCTKSIVIKTETEDIELLDNYNNKFFLYKDNDKIKLYKNEKSSILNIPIDFSYYKLIADNNDVYGVSYNNESKNAYYSIKLNKEIYVDKYDSITPVNSKYISALKNNNGNYEVSLLSTSDEKVLLTEKYSEKDSYAYLFMPLIIDSDGYIAVVKNDNKKMGFTSEKVYTKDLKLISDNFYDLKVDKEKKLYILDQNGINIYDENGNKIESDSSYGEIMKIANRFILHKVDNTLKISTLNMSLREIADLKDNKIRNYNTTNNEIIVEIESTKNCKDGYKHIFNINTMDYKKEKVSYCK